MAGIKYHFLKVAHKYRNIRTTDLEPIQIIEKKLKDFPDIIGADVGCGAGRYDLKLFQHLEKLSYLYCLDSGTEMLKQLKKYLTEQDIKNFQTKLAYARAIPLRDDSVHSVFTFNAVHHFKLLNFLKESARVLKEGGYLFIYTRTRSQNAVNIWGRFFPLFNEKEKRLYELNELEKTIRKVKNLKIETVEFLTYKRVSSLDRLVEKARHHSYSTFYLYSKKDFDSSLNKFKQNIRKNFKNLKNINWTDENLLLIIKKQG